MYGDFTLKIDVLGGLSSWNAFSVGISSAILEMSPALLYRVYAVPRRLFSDPQMRDLE